MRSASGSLAGMPTYLVLQPFFAAGRDVGVDAVVGRVAGARDAAVVDAVEDLGGVLGFGVAAEGRLARDQVRLDVIAAGVGGGDELVGAAVEQQRGAGLLADVGVGAGIVEGGSEGEGAEGRSSAAAAGLVGADDAVVVERVRA